MDEINNKSIGQLRELAQNLNVNISGCIDKTEIIEKLVKSGCIEVTEGMPPMEMSREEFNGKSVSQLKFLLLSFGISDRDVIEKSELRSKLITSGRIVFKERAHSNTTEESTTSSYADVPSSSGHAFDSAGAKSSTSPMEQDQVSSEVPSRASPGFQHGHGSTSSIRSTQSEEGYFVLLSDLRAYSLAELRELCARYQVSTVGCVEKSELIERLLESGHIRLLPADQQLSAKADNSAAEGQDEDEELLAPPLGSPTGTPQSKTSSEGSARMDVCSGSHSNGSSPMKTPPRLNAYDHCAPHTTASSSSDANLSTASDFHPQDARLALSVSLLLDMSVREVRSVMDAYNIDSTGCLEKTDMIARIQNCSSIRIVN